MSILENIKSINFWARELRLPLFWLSDMHLNVFSDNALLFYKDRVMHFYHLNHREEKAAKLGYSYFTNAKNVDAYEHDAKKITRVIDEADAYFKKTKLRDLSDAEFERLFFDLVKKLNRYGNIYIKTEELFLADIEKEHGKHKRLIKRLGDIRFSLRKEGEKMFYILLGILLKELSRRKNVKVADLFLYTSNEIPDLFKGKKVRADVIALRAKGYALRSSKKNYSLAVGGEFKKAFSEVVRNKKGIVEFSGQVAMKGSVTGRVRILRHDKRDISKEIMQFKKGEILVTEMTRPDVVMACRKAAAIITDEGGIVSHAAIVARELKIPAIIGTKMATQVLKNGDLVEVDAIKGIVKIIK